MIFHSYGHVTYSTRSAVRIISWCKSKFFSYRFENQRYRNLPAATIGEFEFCSQNLSVSDDSHDKQSQFFFTTDRECNLSCFGGFRSLDRELFESENGSDRLSRNVCKCHSTVRNVTKQHRSRLLRDGTLTVFLNEGINTCTRSKWNVTN